MGLQEYPFKFTKLSNNSPSVISISRDEMSQFMAGVYDDLVEVCGSAMLHDIMDTSRLMVHAQQVY